jgi:hypothetical protein
MDVQSLQFVMMLKSYGLMVLDGLPKTQAGKNAAPRGRHREIIAFVGSQNS